MREIGSKHNHSGYIQIKTKDGWVDEHRYIMERYLGRKLLSTEVVHHINEDRSDNRIQNLRLLTNSEHSRFHWEEITKMVKIRKEENKKLNKRRVLSEEHKRKISESLKGRVNRPLSKEHKKKLSESCKSWHNYKR